MKIDLNAVLDGQARADVWNLRLSVVHQLTEMKITRDRNEETLHIEADKALCDLLRAIGMEDVAEAFEAVPKWYS